MMVAVAEIAGTIPVAEIVATTRTAEIVGLILAAAAATAVAPAIAHHQCVAQMMVMAATTAEIARLITHQMAFAP